MGFACPQLRTFRLSPEPTMSMSDELDVLPVDARVIDGKVGQPVELLGKVQGLTAPWL